MDPALAAAYVEVSIGQKNDETCQNAVGNPTLGKLAYKMLDGARKIVCFGLFPLTCQLAFDACWAVLLLMLRTCS